VIKRLPGWAAHGNITHQADEAIRETLHDVDDPPMRVLGCLIRAFEGGRISHMGQRHSGFFAFQTDPLTDPFVTLTRPIKARALKA
jgi:hypothetical protein